MNIAKELKVFAKDLSILIVEDDESLNEQLVKVAKIFFKNVAFAYDGQEGLALYEKEDFDIVMSDITMPFLNGVELSRKIKNRNENQNIVILSAHSEMSYLIDLIDIGIRQFVQKPCHDQELLYRLLKVSEEIVLSKENLKNKDLNISNLKQTSIQEKPVSEIAKSAPISGQDFTNTLEGDEITWIAVADDISAILELKDDFEHYIEFIYSDKITPEILRKTSDILKKMYIKLSQIDAMQNMTLVLFDLASFIEELDFKTLSEEQLQKFKILEFVYDDISRFIDTVFVYKDSINIYYLEDSLKISVNQLKNNVLNTSFEETELELF